MMGATSGGRGREVATILHLVRPGGIVRRPSLSLSTRSWSAGSDAGVLACIEVAARTPWCEHRIIVVGGDEAGRRGAELGLRADARIAPPLGRAELAAPGL